MIANLKPYPEYKESGLPWVEKVPAHWQVIPNRGIIRKRKSLVGENHSKYRLLSLTKAGVIVRDVASGKGKFSSDMGTSQEVRNGDLVFCLFDVPETPRTVGLSPHNGMITGAYTIFECLNPEHVKYFELFYRAMDDRKLLSPLYSGLRHTIPPSRFIGTKTPQPQPDEQAAIVRFLDYANERLERAIRAKRKVIALLHEQKQAIIHRAVTGQDQVVEQKRADGTSAFSLQPSALPKKPSGIPWLGDIPKHWEVKKLRFLFRYGKGSRAAELTNEYIGRNPGTFPVYSGQTEGGGLMGSINWHEFDFPSPVVFVSTVGARAMSTRLVQGKFSLSQNCALIIPRRDDVSVEFFENVFQRLFAYERTSISLIMQPSLRFADLNRFYVPHPPHGEQLEIVKGLSREVAALHTAINRLEREIELLREYRTRLVADVVTGKLDVRPAARHLPAEASEPETAILAEDLPGEMELEPEATE